MRHEHECGAVLAVEFEDEIDHRSGVLTIEIPSRLITKEDLGFVNKRACQGHPLLLTTGELHRIMILAIAQPHASQQGASFRLTSAFAA